MVKTILSPTISKLIFFMVLLSYSFCQYSKPQSYNLNCYSAITHCSQDQILTWNCKICKQCQKLNNITYIQNTVTNVMGYVGYMPSKNAILIVMRGTKDIRNWLEDFSFKMINYAPCRGCLIHEGFYYGYQSIYAKFHPALVKLTEMYPSAKIVATGSSLGGALATVAALQTQLTTGKVAQLHVFGCPRVGNTNYAQFLRIKIPVVFRVIHNKDIVPHVPLVSQGFYHPAYQILYDEQMETYRQCDSSGEDPTCSDAYYPNFAVSDHTSYWFKPVEQDECNL